MEDLKELAMKLGYAWPDDDAGQWRVLKQMAARAAYWRDETEKYRTETQREVEQQKLYAHQRQRVGALTKKVFNLRKALRDYMKSQAAFVRECRAEVANAIRRNPIRQSIGGTGDVRYLIAIDENGVFLRRALCLTDNIETKERQYSALPFKEADAPGAIREALRYLRDHQANIQIESSRFETKDPHELRREQFQHDE